MAAKPKSDPHLETLGMLSEQHAKSEQHDSRLTAMEQKLESTLSEFDSKLAGAAPVIIGLIRAEIDAAIKAAIDKYKTEDRAEDRKLFAQLIQEHDGPTEVTRHGTVETPEGIHKMTVVETRRRKVAQ